MLDELHRTGAKEWGEKLNTLIDNQPESTKVLGITATPRRDADGINMANEMAQRLGYTNREAVSGKHIAMNMSLTNAIRMGLVVNPKLVSCVYSLKTDGSLDKLKAEIEQIDDIQEKNQKLEKYESLRRNVENAEGIPEILQTNIKKGGKYLVFLPVVENLEDEDGNVIGRKKGKDKIADYERQIAEYFKGSSIIPNFHSMIGEYGDKENARRLEEFQNSNTEETEFMLVMNKANEGLHLDKLDGMIWLRAMDENSRILYLQQLGRVIYSEDPDKPTKDEDRPVVIDLVNNTLKVNWENEITEQDDIQMLNLIVDWTERHNGTLPDINSSDKEESGYASVLKEIQNKYKGYLENEFDGFNEKQIEEVREIVRLGSQIDLWQIELPNRIAKDGGTQVRGFTDKNTGPFELTGLLKDFVELGEKTDIINNKNAVERFIEKLEKMQEIGVDVSKMAKRDTIRRLAKKSGISEEKIKEIGLNPEDKIGISKKNIAKRYRKDRSYVSEEQLKILEELGISLELRNVPQEFIETLERMQGIEIDTSKLTTMDTIGSLAKKSGISEEKIKEIGLNPEDKIGISKKNIAKRYRKDRSYVSEEQLKILEELGISLELRNVPQEFIETLEKMQEIGVDVSKIVRGDTIGSLAKKSGISEEKILEIGLNPEDKIENSKRFIATSYRKDRSYVSEEQLKILEKLGISLEFNERNVPQEFIETLEKMQETGVDVSKLVRGDTIGSLAKKSGISEEKILEMGLNPNDNIGPSKKSLATRYRKNRNYVNEEQLKRLEKLGTSLELNKRNVPQKFIETLERMQEIGVEVSKIVQRDTIGSLAKKSGISEEKITKIGLNPEDKIGISKNYIAISYRKDRSYVSEEQLKILEELGISLEKNSRTGKEIAEASISSLTDIEMSDREDIALKELVEKTKEGGIKRDE